jgi:hypothetical protein
LTVLRTIEYRAPRDPCPAFGRHLRLTVTCGIGSTA